MHALQRSVIFAEGDRGGGEAFFALGEQGGGSAVQPHISGKALAQLGDDAGG